MKIILAIFLIGSFVQVFAQGRKAGKIEKIQLIGKWKSDYNVFSDESKLNYQLEAIDPGSDQYFIWGNFITIDSSAFNTYYSASCGNDCFTSVTGSYKWAGLNRILVYVEEINRSGFCTEKSESPKKSFGYYLLEKTERGFNIKKENQK